MMNNIRALKRQQTLQNSDTDSDSDVSVADSHLTLVGSIRKDGKPKFTADTSVMDKMWSEAIQKLSEKDRSRILQSTPVTGQRQIYALLIDGIQKQQQRVRESELHYRGKEGDPVYIRDKMEKVVTWFTKSQLYSLGNMLSGASIYAGIPWACISTIFTITETQITASKAVFEAIEDISNLLARYSHYEQSYLQENGQYDESMKEKLKLAIIKTFIAMLEFLANSIRYYKGSEKRRKRLLQTFTASSVNTMVTDTMKKVNNADAEVIKILGLMDVDYQRQTRLFMDVNFADMKNVLSNLQIHMDELDASLKGDDQKIKTLVDQIVKSMEPKLIPIDILKTWLGGWVIEDSYLDASEIRLQDTCQWLLQREEYIRWKARSPETKLLWVYGPPGSGKSVLCATAINDLRKGDIKNLAYYFCTARFENTRNPESIVRSWVQQLLNDGFAHKAASEYYEKQKLENQASMQHIWELFTKIAMKMEDCICVLDGLDECFKLNPVATHKSTTNRWVEFLKSLEKHSKGTSARILLVSRDEPDIRQNLETWDNITNPVLVTGLEVKSEYTRADIQAYAHKSVEDALAYAEEPVSAETVNKLASLAAEKSKGMFLYIALLKDRLEQYAGSERTEESYFNAINDLGDYDEAYGRILERIQSYPGERKTTAEAVLRWILFAVRPLQLQELAEALEAATTIKKASSVPRTARGSLPPASKLTFKYFQRIVSLCGSFVVVTERGTPPNTLQTIDFVHFTAKEFLLAGPEDGRPSQKDGFQFEDEYRHQGVLAQICLAYLSSDDFKQPEKTMSKLYIQEKRMTYKFLEYAASYWYVHLNNSDSRWIENDNLQALLEQFFSPKNNTWLLWSYLYEFKDMADTIQSPVTVDYTDFRPPNQLYYCAMFGLVPTMKYLKKIRAFENVNSIVGRLGTPLQAASSNGHTEAVDLLLSWGANPNIGDQSDNALQAAVKSSVSSTVSLLLQYGAKIDDDLLLQALRSNNMEIFNQLWDAIEKSGSQIENKEMLLDAVAKEPGGESFLKLLLKSGTSITWQNGDSETVLHRAACAKQIGNTRLILKEAKRRGTLIQVVNATNRHQKTPLWEAAHAGSVELVELLFEYDADLNKTDNKKRTPLHGAAMSGEVEVIKYLLDRGADITAIDNSEATALRLAARHSRLDAVKLLVEAGANVNARSKEGDTAIFEAAHSGKHDLLCYLLDNGADVDVINYRQMSALSTAVIRGNNQIVEELIQRGAEVDRPNIDGWSPLHECALYGRPTIAAILISKGATINRKDFPEGRAPLQIAAENNRGLMVKLLLQHGADPNVRQMLLLTPLHKSVSAGFIEVSTMLLDAGADANAVDCDGVSIFHKCWVSGSRPLAELLVSYGADISKKRKDDFTALHYACFENKPQFCKFLLDHNINMEDRTREGYTGLHLAVLRGHENICSMLIEKGMNVNLPDRNSWTALHWAAHHGHHRIAELLVSCKDINLEALNEHFMTPMNEAVHRDKIEVMKVLAKAGADIERPSNDSAWPLSHEAVLMDRKTYKTMLDIGADFWARDRYSSTAAMTAAANDKWDQLRDNLEHLEKYFPDRKQEYFEFRNAWNRTALIDACHQKHEKCIELLIKFGANPNSPGMEYMIRPLTLVTENNFEIGAMKLLDSPTITFDEPKGRHCSLHHTMKHRMLKTAQKILARDTDKYQVNHPGLQGMTPLMLGAIEGRPVMMQWLINAGADMYARDAREMTAIHHAAAWGRREAIDVLIKNRVDLECKDGWTRTALAVAVDAEQEIAFRHLLANGAKKENLSSQRLWFATMKQWI